MSLAGYYAGCRKSASKDMQRVPSRLEYQDGMTHSVTVKRDETFHQHAGCAAGQ
jgi:hypothetical protein